MMKKIKTIAYLILLVSIAACSKMDDNYKQYLEMDRIYSPKISNLEAIVGLKKATLLWENPPGNIATKILVDYRMTVCFLRLWWTQFFLIAWILKVIPFPYSPLMNSTTIPFQHQSKYSPMEKNNISYNSHFESITN